MFKGNSDKDSSDLSLSELMLLGDIFGGYNQSGSYSTARKSQYKRAKKGSALWSFMTGDIVFIGNERIKTFALAECKEMKRKSIAEIIKTIAIYLFCLIPIGAIIAAAIIANDTKDITGYIVYGSIILACAAAAIILLCRVIKDIQSMCFDIRRMKKRIRYLKKRKKLQITNKM